MYYSDINMGHEKLQKYIDQLNSGDKEEIITSKKINKKVDLIKILPKEDKEKDSILPPYIIFFINNETNKYVGAVLDMYFDLQWYVVKEYRGKGHLTKALKEAILPFIFSDSRKHRRDRQEITIDGDFYKESRQVAESLGFKQIDPSTKTPTKFELRKADFEKILQKK
jgi:hypothetical protein